MKISVLGTKISVKEQTKDIKSLAEQNYEIVIACPNEISETWGYGSFAGADPDRSSTDGTVIVFEDDSFLVYHAHLDAWAIG